MTILKSPQREKFSQLIALKEKSHYEAYLEAYPTSVKWSRQAVDSKAYELASNGEIMVRINELKATLTDKVIEKFAKTKDDILIKLESLIDKIEEKTVVYDKDGLPTMGVPTKDAVKEIRECLKEQGKLLGYYEEVHKLKGDKDAPLETNINIIFVNKKEKE